MSVATEITRLQGIKSDIRTALVTQGIVQASSHNMADFSADILAIQGSGGEGVYITVTCYSVYIGYDIILSANESELDRKQCPSSKEVNLFVSADDITLPATFTISNSLNDITTSVTANVYGWYETNLRLEPIALVPVMTSNTTPYGTVIYNSQRSDGLGYYAFDNKSTTRWGSDSTGVSGAYIGYRFTNKVSIRKLLHASNDKGTQTCKVQYSDDGSNWNDTDTVYTINQNDGDKYINTNNNGYHLYWRVYLINSTNTNSRLWTTTLQFYGFD